MSRVLIVEDEEAIADLEKDYLELSGFTVEIENNGTAGLKRALSEEFDMFILDLMLRERMDLKSAKRSVRKKYTNSYGSAKKMILTRSEVLGLVRTITSQNHFLQVSW